MRAEDKKLKPDDYTKKLNAASTILRFMGYLATKHTAMQMHYLWRSMDTMLSRYGDIFVADAIKKDKNGALLALWTLGQERRVVG